MYLYTRSNAISNEGKNRVYYDWHYTYLQHTKVSLYPRIHEMHPEQQVPR
jgi:hypothetical protein